MEPYEVVLIALFTFIIGAVIGAAVMYAINSKKEDEKQINHNTVHTHTRVGSVTNTAGTKKPTETVGYHGTKNNVEKSPSPPRRVCVGNCSTCNRDHCIEDR